MRDGVLAGFVGCCVDVTDCKSAATVAKSLTSELNHRVNNLLATVNSLSRLTFTDDTAPSKGRRRFNRRVGAMSAVHQLLGKGAWRGANVRELVKQVAAIEPSVSDRIRVEGDDAFLKPAQVQSLLMALQELLSNAVEFGSLSRERGAVLIDIVVTSADMPYMELRWEEIGGPQVDPKLAQGFGTRLVERVLPREVGGSSSLDFRSDGVVFTLSMPL